MSWLQLHLHTQANSADHLEQLLLNQGALSVTLQDNADQPLLEPGVGETPLWESTKLSALFPQNINLENLLDALSQQLGHPLPSYEVEMMADEDWERRWLDDFSAMQFGQQLWIVPSWQTPPDPNACNIILDPGLAFGTGTHPTTAMCLEWLAVNPMKGLSVIDYGCGSGILAMAALLLGAELAICVDNDPQALMATATNAEQNGIDASKLVTCLPEELDGTLKQQFGSAKHGCDLLMANILAGPLITLAPRLIDLLRDGGQIMLSGILSEQCTAVTSAYASSMMMQLPHSTDQWIRLNGQK
ncbi:MAG: 50S ribosomal protein L11 methyltransferase [Cellvibrionales bacterium]|nr:50S ribosomal protein L11 methyltransferase [Cellvibrionales bacterium]|tara:strand:+ start:276 stop:1181 length:906 start_codon:yes stop_codon:yes gene_type:complete